MKSLFTLLLITVALSVNAQIKIDSFQFKPKTYQYAQVTAVPRLLSNKVNIIVDMGQHLAFLADTRFKDSTGDVVKFTTVVDMLNYMDSMGWECISSFFCPNSKEGSYVYLFRRKME